MKSKILQIIVVALLMIVATISCKKDVSLNGFVLDETLTVYVDETATITVTFIPKNASNKNLIWVSSDSTVAIVNNGKVTGRAVGEAKITVTSKDVGRTAYCIVSVIQPIEPKDMILVEGGTFTMGCTDELSDDCFAEEKPSHKVTLSSFYIGKYEVTQKEWFAAMGKNSSHYKGDNLPVETVSWHDIQLFIQRLNTATGKKYRLPTEAEWEYAARGGKLSEGYKYSGGDNLNDVAWHYGNCSSTTHLVGTKKPNELGICDMSGNVFEFCSDWYGAYTATPLTNPTGPESGNGRIVRGGGIGMGVEAFYSRVLFRVGVNPDASGMNVGFRLVLPKD